MRLPQIDQLNFYRAAGCAGLSMLTLGYLFGGGAETGTREMGWAVAIGLAFFGAGVVASFLSAEVRAHFARVALASVICISSYFAIWLYQSDVSQAAMTDALLFEAIAILMFHTPTLVLTFVGTAAPMLLAGALLSDAGTTLKINFCTSTAALVSLVTLLKLHILNLDAARAQERNLRESLFDQMSEILILLGPGGVGFRTMNAAAVEQFGSTNGSVVWSSIVNAFEEAGVDRAAAKAHAHEHGEWTAELRFRRIGGADFIGRATFNRLVDATKRTLILRITDITDLIEQNAALEKARREAEEAMAVQGRFLANMSHEIRTPMNGVIGMTSLLANTSLTDEQQGCLDIIRSSGESLLTIINEILDFSKLEAGRVELEEQPFDLEQCVAEALDTVLPLANEKGLETILDLRPADRLRLRGDVQRIRQVIVNLLSNAIKFTEHGEIRVTVRTEAEHGATEHAPTRIDCQVTDTGIGIPEAMLDSLFEAFIQADASTTRRFGGTGLGLSISRSLVELMGGDLRVVSQEGVGSTFSFHIWMTSLGHRDSSPTTELAGRHVLTVDDNATNRAVLEGMLGELNIRVTSCSTPQEALACARTAAPDAIISDLAMPEMDGVAMLQALKQQWPDHPPAILLTSLDQGWMDTRHFSVGLRKPVRPTELISALQMSLSATPGLPVERPAPEAEATRFVRIQGRVLLAEDNIVNQKVARQLLGKLGVTADVVSDGREALEQVKQAGYRLVFMDMQMPEVDGIEATRRIRADAAIAQPYIVAMTANARDADRQTCLEAGMDDFIAKPIDLEAVDAALQRAIETGVFDEPRAPSHRGRNPDSGANRRA